MRSPYLNKNWSQSYKFGGVRELNPRLVGVNDVGYWSFNSIEYSVQGTATNSDRKLILKVANSMNYFWKITTRKTKVFYLIIGQEIVGLLLHVGLLSYKEEPTFEKNLLQALALYYS